LAVAGSAVVPGEPKHARITPRVITVIAGAAIFFLLSPPADSAADADLSLHMFQHIGLFAFAMVFGYGFERFVMSKLAALRKLTYLGWRAFTFAMVANTRTRGAVFVLLVPAAVFVYWHAPQNFDLAVQSEPVHIAEHLTYLVAGSFVGLSLQAVKPKWKVALLYVAFMHAGIMGSIWSVWQPPFFPLYSYAANIAMDTSLLVFGAIGVVVTSSWMLKVLDII